MTLFNHTLIQKLATRTTELMVVQLMAEILVLD